MIDRNKVIEGLEMCTNISQDGCLMLCPYKDEKDETYSGFCEQVLKQDVLALLKEQEWHMLTEDDDGIIHGLPGDDGQYFMTDGKDIWIDEYVDGVADGIILDSGRDIREITAWMYMPGLPKKGRR